MKFIKINNGYYNPKYITAIEISKDKQYYFVDIHIIEKSKLSFNFSSFEDAVKCQEYFVNQIRQ